MAPLFATNALRCGNVFQACSWFFQTRNLCNHEPLKPQNYETYMYEYETVHETYEAESMKLRNTWNHETHEITKPRALRKVSMKQLSLGETYDYETYETCENHVTFEITKLKKPRWKPWNVETLITAIKTLNLIPWMLWNLLWPKG